MKLHPHEVGDMCSAFQGYISTDRLLRLLHQVLDVNPEVTVSSISSQSDLDDSTRTREEMWSQEH